MFIQNCHYRNDCPLFSSAECAFVVFWRIFIVRSWCWYLLLTIIFGKLRAHCQCCLAYTENWLLLSIQQIMKKLYEMFLFALNDHTQYLSAQDTFCITGWWIGTGFSMSDSLERLTLSRFSDDVTEQLNESQCQVPTAAVAITAESSEFFSFAIWKLDRVMRQFIIGSWHSSSWYATAWVL